MQKKIRFTSLLLCIVMVLSTFSMTVWGAENDKVTVYFMARGVNAQVKKECVKLTVDKGTTVSDVTYAMDKGLDEVTSGSGAAWYSELFGEGNGLAGIYSGWSYFVDNYNPINDLSNEYEVYDGMFILWEYVDYDPTDWSLILPEPVDFAAERAKADKADSEIEVYFMARGVNAQTKQNCVKLTVNKGVSVSDVTLAMTENKDTATSGSGLGWYSELFGEGNGLAGIYSGWSYFVDNYDFISDLSNEYKAYDGMFILWEYVDYDPTDWSLILPEPVDFAAECAKADEGIATDLTDDAVRGDSNNDGIVTAADSALILQYVLDSGTQLSEGVSDMNRTGTLTADDAALVLQRVLNGAA